MEFWSGEIHHQINSDYCDKNVIRRGKEMLHLGEREFMLVIEPYGHMGDWKSNILTD
jgi:hypothetical protein